MSRVRRRPDGRLGDRGGSNWGKKRSGLALYILVQWVWLNGTDPEGPCTCIFTQGAGAGWWLVAFPVGGDNDENYEDDEFSIAVTSPAGCALNRLSATSVNGICFENVGVARIFLCFLYECIKREFGSVYKGGYGCRELCVRGASSIGKGVCRAVPGGQARVRAPKQVRWGLVPHPRVTRVYTRVLQLAGRRRDPAFSYASRW